MQERPLAGSRFLWSGKGQVVKQGRVTDKSGLEPISVRVSQAVQISGLSRSRIYELMKSGDIEFAKIGSSTLILVGSLRRFIESRRSVR